MHSRLGGSPLLKNLLLYNVNKQIAVREDGGLWSKLTDWKIVKSYLFPRCLCINGSAEIQVCANQENKDENELHVLDACHDSVE